jgi:aspartyl-tRNA(Asn)/glutamyl-tRNA(Gln) amidotransferase subunit A
MSDFTRPLHTIAHALAHGETSSVALVEACLANIEDPHGEGQRAFIQVNRERALQDAARIDEARKRGDTLPTFAGIPISIKDLFDVKGEVTRAGSIILADAPPAREDAPAIARLHEAGFIFIGRTNMTEFAYGGHGLNEHYGTPRNPWDRAVNNGGGRIPGGSTSGGAVSVTDGMAHATIGSDTGGSVRIPAALCGITGFKPTQARIPLEGAFPLSPTRDSVGPLGHSAACCIALNQIMAGEHVTARESLPLKGRRFAVPMTILQDNMDETVSRAFTRACDALRDAGATLTPIPFDVLRQEVEGSRKANFSAVEAYALHRERLANDYSRFDWRVAKRLDLGRTMLAADYFDLVQARKRWIAMADEESKGFDALLAPTIPIVAPTFADVNASEAELYRLNGLILRNPAPFNVLNRPCWSLPCHREGEAPFGLMVVGETNGDHALERLGLSIEAALTGIRSS